MREPNEIVIGDVTYKMYPMSPFKSSKILTRILKLIGKPLATIVGDAKNQKKESLLEADVSPELIGEALSLMTDNLDENQIEKLMRDLLPLDLLSFASEGEDFKKISNLDGHLNKQEKPLSHLFRLAKFSLEVNYADFLDEIVGLKG